MAKVKVAILRVEGTNCDQELFFAFRKAGAYPEMVQVNSLIAKKNLLRRCHILALPGGFSYGDDILSGKILANELLYKLRHEIVNFIKEKKLVIGICNGFQTLVRMGLLPGGGGPAELATLIFNDSAHFECRWIKLRIEKSISVWTKGLEGKVIELPVAHGEGKFITRDNSVLKTLNKRGQISFRYSYANGMVATSYPENPNSSIEAIAGITDKSGRVLGLMPHPERFTQITQYPNWTRLEGFKKKPDGLLIFQNAVKYFN